MYTSMKSGGVRHCMNHVYIHETRYVLPGEDKKRRSISEQVRYFGRNHNTSANARSVHHRAWRSWSCVKLLCLCDRLRLGVVPTYHPLNSWSSRSSSCEESLFPCLHTHIVEDFKLSPRNWRSWNAFWRFCKISPIPRPTNFPAVTPSSGQKFQLKIGFPPKN